MGKQKATTPHHVLEIVETFRLASVLVLESPIRSSRVSLGPVLSKTEEEESNLERSVKAWGEGAFEGFDFVAALEI